MNKVAMKMPSLAMLLLMAGCNEMSRDAMVLHRREGVVKAYDEREPAAQNLNNRRTDLSELRPQAGLDRALGSQLAQNHQGDMEVFQPEEERKRSNSDAFTLEPKNDNGPVIFLKPVKP